VLCYADFKQEQDMEIEALEAILMDEFKGLFLYEWHFVYANLLVIRFFH